MQECVTDVIQYASQLGRLDFVSTILASIGIILAVGGLFAYFDIKTMAKERATDVATEIAKQVAQEVATIISEKVAKEVAQSVLPGYVKSYMPLNLNLPDPEKANQIAETQDNINE